MEPSAAVRRLGMQMGLRLTRVRNSSAVGLSPSAASYGLPLHSVPSFLHWLLSSLDFCCMASQQREGSSYFTPRAYIFQGMESPFTSQVRH